MVSEGACRVRWCGAAAADAFALGCGPRQPIHPSILPPGATATASRHEAGSRDIRVSQGSKASSCLSRLPARSPPLARILLCCLAASVPCVAFCPVPSSAATPERHLLGSLCSYDWLRLTTHSYLFGVPTAASMSSAPSRMSQLGTWAVPPVSLSSGTAVEARLRYQQGNALRATK